MAAIESAITATRTQDAVFLPYIRRHMISAGVETRAHRAGCVFVGLAMEAPKHLRVAILDCGTPDCGDDLPPKRPVRILYAPNEATLIGARLNYLDEQFEFCIPDPYYGWDG